MSFVQITRVSGVTSDQYDEIMRSAHSGALADGELFRVAGKGGEDAWYVIDGWNSREQCERSLERLMPAFGKAGLSMESMAVEEFEIHEFKATSGEPVARR
jgi:hypothetical protein